MTHTQNGLFDTPPKEEWHTRCPETFRGTQCGKHRGHEPPCTVAELPGYPWSKDKRSRRPAPCSQ